MPQMNFDLEDGKEPVSFSLTAADADRFQAFMVECNGYLKRAERLEKLHSVERERADALDTHLDRFMDATDEVAMADDDWVENLQRVRNDSPSTSLAKLKSRVAAEALAKLYDATKASGAVTITRGTLLDEAMRYKRITDEIDAGPPMSNYPTEAAYLAACKAIEKHRKRADTAERERDALTVRYAALAEELRGIIQDSDGVAGYHLNGDIAAWGEFDIEALLEDPGADAPETSLAQLKARVAAGGFAEGLRQAVRICESYANEHDNEDRAFGARAVAGVMKAQADKADVIAAGGGHE